MPYEVLKVRRRAGRAGVVISARFTAEEADAIQQAADFYDTTLSQIVRRFVLERVQQPLVKVRHAVL